MSEIWDLLKNLWRLLTALAGLGLMIFGVVDLVKFNRTHDPYYGIDCLICWFLARIAAGRK